MKNQLFLLSFLLITIATAGKAQQTTIPMPGTTHGVAVNEKANEFYVTSQDYLLVIDAATRTFKTAFRLPYLGAGVCVSPTGILAVTMYSPQTPVPAVSVIDPAAGTIETVWDYAMWQIGGCSFSPDGTLYVGSSASLGSKNPTDLQQLTAFTHDSKGWTVSKTWHFLDVGYVANILALNNKVYAVTVSGQTNEIASLMVINVSQEPLTTKVITTMPSGRAYGWRWPFSLSPDGRRLYVPVASYITGGKAGALVVDTASDELVDPLFSTPDLTPFQIVFSGADTSFSYWLNNAVWKYDFRTNTVSPLTQFFDGGQSIDLQVIRQPAFDLLAILLQDRLVLQEVPRVPAIFALTNGASFSTDPVVSPGEWISLFGRSLSFRTVTADKVPLPTELEGTKVWAQVGNNQPVALPLVFVSVNQINAQFPTEVPVGASVKLWVEGPGNQKSDSITVSVVAATPALFAWPDRSPILANVSGQLVFQVVPDGVFTLYATGLGQVIPQVTSGRPAPFNPLAWAVNQVQVFVAGRPCEVLFSGLSPGWVGLYQLNIQIPADVPTGKQGLVISQAGSSVEYQITISGGLTQ